MVYATVAPQRLTPELDGLLTTSVMIPPDSEIVAKYSVSGIRPHGCALVEPARCLTEEYGVVVGHTLVDASSGSGSVLIVNPNAEVVVLPGCTLIGKLVPVAAISVAMEETILFDGPAALPEYLEEIVGGSHPSLGDAGRQQLRNLLFRYSQVFPAPGEPVTGRTTAVQHDIIMTDARPVRCGPRRLAPAGLNGSTRFCVDYRILNALTTKDTYPLPRIDDWLRLLGNQRWFPTMDLESGYWQVAMLPEAKRKAAFVTNEGLFQFRVMPFRLCNAPTTFERLIDRVLCGMRWSRCLVYLDDVISFGGTVTKTEKKYCAISVTSAYS